MFARLLLLALVLAAACHRADAQGGSGARLYGYSSFSDLVPGVDQTGTVRVILRGIGDIADECPDAPRRVFLAEYDGKLEVSRDATFTASLEPFDPPVATPMGCIVTSVRIERIDAVTIDAKLPGLALEGHGYLDTQNLSSLDNDELQRGELGPLHAQMVFVPETPCR